jgi:hypothetical protein
MGVSTQQAVARADMLEEELVRLRKACNAVLADFGEYEWREIELPKDFVSCWVPVAKMISTEVIDELAKVLQHRGEEGIETGGTEAPKRPIKRRKIKIKRRPVTNG